MRPPVSPYSPRLKKALFVTVAVAGLTAAMPALVHAQDTAADEEITEVVVTGFRGSLRSALSVKRTSAATVDSILSEDIAKFPDTNLAESMQRIPGVALQRGDGGEGKSISVRGLGAGFTRVRLNGMEGAAQTGASDIYGAGNSGRGFDFNVFPSEIFSSLTTRKTSSADVEEGSLGATVDLRSPRAFDYRDDQVLSFTAKGVYNELSKSTDPRLSLLAAKKFGDGKFGLLGTLTYQKRNIREVGFSSHTFVSGATNSAPAILRDSAGNPVLDGGGNIQTRNIPFCSPIGWTTPDGYYVNSPDPTTYASKGATATQCATGNPRTSDTAAFNTIYNLRSTNDQGVQQGPGSGAYFPRMPRYLNSEQDTERMGGTLSFQWRPDSNTELGVDLLYSKFEVERRDNYIAAVSFARNIGNNGSPMTSVREVEFNEHGSLHYGLFDGVDVRSEALLDVFSTEFKQINLYGRHRFNDRFEINGYLGVSESVYDSPMRLTVSMDAIDVDNVSIDYRDGASTPVIDFGMDVSDPANFAYAPGPADGTVLGLFNAAGKPGRNKTKNTNFALNGIYDLSDTFVIKFGGQYRVNHFQADWVDHAVTGQSALKPLPTGTTLASLTRQISGLDDLWGRGAPASWAAIDHAKWMDAVDYDSFKWCGVECGAGHNEVREEIKSTYIMAEFNSDSWLPVPVRGDFGIRSVYTQQHSVGYIPVNAPVGSPYPRAGLRNDVERDYHDLLPSANVVFELTPDVLARVSAAKVMARPELGGLIPTTTVNPVTAIGGVNNPFLEPFRAKTFDAALEWYYRPGSVVSVAYFYKDIDTYIQSVNEEIPFNQLGLPNSLLDVPGGVAPDHPFAVSRPVNTPGGPLHGIELNLQAELDFLPGLWSNFGVLGNVTYITSEIDYVLASNKGVPTLTTTDDLLGLSRRTASGTIYYEDNKLNVRLTGSYRDKFMYNIPPEGGGVGNMNGNDSSFYLDASAGYALSDKLKLTLEASNLTDEQKRLYIDSTREDTIFETRVGRTVIFGISYKY